MKSLAKAIFVSAMIFSAPAKAMTPEDRLAGLMNGPDKSWFAASFLAAVPYGQVRSLMRDLSKVMGPVTDVTPSGEGYVIRSATHSVKAQIALDGAGQIIGLYFDPPQALLVTLEQARDGLLALKGEVAFMVMRGGDVILEQGSDRSLAVGSAFKIAILAELAAQVQAGGRDWADVVTLRDRHKSLPSGDMRDLPDGTPVTLAHAAALMISQSDNTATDLLMDVVGADAVARRLGVAHALTTRQFFALKADTELAAGYVAGDAATRRTLADQAAARPLPHVSSIGPFVPGLEWQVPATRLCQIMAEVQGLPAMQINPGVIDAQDWASVAFKGGSEVGVLNLTTWARPENGPPICAVLTVNHDQALEEAEIAQAYSALFTALRE
ncbi:serine hydrolase [Pseudoprimorskyibacter insulae]|uniref:Beta-lactamase class A catalytic domain-containing protein n=1 Tax=Pseudoprimorskyibacter insulae TaxID=1695997 RepID=A0A2R8APX0_9RHOB|nr:serine hydrolase [Pseudoprimorskyibacter insulae]SPF77919.1 hypothetical protein PRI8871_00506 [Pseudoprimorskyibacter insulae]